MFVVRALPGERRLDPQYYSPDVSSDLEKVAQFSRLPLDLLRVATAPIVYGVLKPDQRGHGCRVIKAEDFSQSFVSLQDCDPLSDELFQQFRRAEALAGDILVAIGGHVGRPAVVMRDSGDLVAAVNRHLARVRIDPSRADPMYVLSFLGSAVGERLLRREVSGSVQAGINLEDLRLVDVPCPDRNAQLYIGSKVRQAGRLREWARGMRSVAQNFVSANFLVPTTQSLRERPRRMPVSVLDPDSLDPDFALAAQGHLLMPSTITIEKMKEACRSGDPIRADERKPGPYPYHGASGPIDWHDDWNIEGDFVLVAQDGSIGRACVVRGRAWANNHVWVLSVRPEFDLDAIAFFLNDYYPYWSGLTTGSVVPKVLADNLMRVHVPEVVARAMNEVGEPLRQANIATKYAGGLVTAARLLVEALIERKVTEAELIDAGKDPSLDRAILARLAEDGLDGVGAPLFPDLEGLEALIAEAKR